MNLLGGLCGLHLRSLVSRVGDLFYPGRCMACEAFHEGRGILCPACEMKLAGLESAAGCRHCGRPIVATDAPCPWCVGKGMYPYGQVLRLGVFEEPLRTMIHRLKYHRRWPVGEILADRLLAQPRVRDMMPQITRIVPVPLYRWRHWGRGYNQAEVIARRLARCCRLKLAGALHRTRDTETQTVLRSRRLRQENVRGAFALRDPAAVRDQHLLVVDDVMTSGATLQAVGRTLLQGHPASLTALVVAVADPKGRSFTTV